jgi:hypothetical protein
VLDSKQRTQRNHTAAEPAEAPAPRRKAIHA